MPTDRVTARWRGFVMRGVRLPDLHALVGREEQRVGLLGLERVVPEVEVAHGRDPELRRAVRVGDQAVGKLLRPIEAAPHLAPAEEEALFTRGAVDDRRRLAAERELVRV